MTAKVRAYLGRLISEGRGGVQGAVLACAPGEQHDIGLLMLAVMLRADGWRVEFLGADTPVDAAVAFAGRIGANMLCLSASRSESVACSADTLAADEPADLMTIVVGGAAMTPEIARELGATYAGEQLDVAVERLRSPRGSARSSTFTSGLRGAGSRRRPRRRGCASAGRGSERSGSARARAWPRRRRSAPTATSGARGARADQADQRHEDRRQADERLALEEADQGEEGVAAEVGDGVDPAAVGERVGVQPGRRGEDEHQHDHRRAEHRGDDGLPALVLPVDVLEVEHERELVEHERRAGAEGDRGEVDDRGARVGRERDQAADEDEHDAREPCGGRACRRAGRSPNRGAARAACRAASARTRAGTRGAAGGAAPCLPGRSPPRTRG